LRAPICRVGGVPAGLALLALAAGCSRPALPGALVGESTHFRLFVDPDFDPSTLPAYLQGAGALDALETDWADKQTMLKMPEGRPKIDYHLVAPGHVAAACQGQAESGCELGDKLQIAASTLPYQHELIHAYMEFVAPGVTPLPLLVEGIAESIRCQGRPDALTRGAYLPEQVPWQQVVTESASDSRQGEDLILT
jgi:hypothetical protein